MLEESSDLVKSDCLFLSLCFVVNYRLFHENLAALLEPTEGSHIAEIVP